VLCCVLWLCAGSAGSSHCGRPARAHISPPLPAKPIEMMADALAPEQIPLQPKPATAAADGKSAAAAQFDEETQGQQTKEGRGVCSRSVCSRWTRGGLFSLGGVGVILSVMSVGSLCSLASLGSAASVASILSLGSVASILSIGSVGSVLSIGCSSQVLKHCPYNYCCDLNKQRFAGDLANDATKAPATITAANVARVYVVYGQSNSECSISPSTLPAASLTERVLVHYRGALYRYSHPVAGSHNQQTHAPDGGGCVWGSVGGALHKALGLGADKYVVFARHKYVDQKCGWTESTSFLISDQRTTYALEQVRSVRGGGVRGHLHRKLVGLLRLDPISGR
jgi:hypothetical protein